MSIQDVYNRLFDRIREIRVDEFVIILKNLEGRRFKRGLEIGCGDGTQSILLIQICDELISSDVNSSDIPPERLAQLQFVVADAENLPFPDKHFELIYSSNVLEHVENLDKAFKEMKRVLADDGLMIHSMPNGIWKILQLVLWFPFRFKILLAKIGEIIFKSKSKAQKESVREFGSQKRDVKRFNPWFPPIHGVARSHYEELLLFRVSRWFSEFNKAGFKVEKSFPLLLYSAWNVGPSWLRKFLERSGLWSSHCFFVNNAK